MKFPYNRISTGFVFQISVVVNNFTRFFFFKSTELKLKIAENISIPFYQKHKQNVTEHLERNDLKSYKCAA